MWYFRLRVRVQDRSQVQGGDTWLISLLKDSKAIQTIEGLLATFCIDVSAEF